MDKHLEVLLAAGIDESIAKSMLKALQPKPEKKKKKTFYGNFNSRKKIIAPVTVVLTCMTCGTKSSHKKTAEVYSDETDIKLSSVTGLCINCIGMFEIMTKEELIALVIIQNHSDMQLRQFSTATQIKMAKQKSAKEWLLTRLRKPIANRDEEKFIITDSEKEDKFVTKSYV